MLTHMKKAARLAVGALVFGLAQPAAASGLGGPPASFDVSVSAGGGTPLTFTPVLTATPAGDFTGSAAGSNSSLSFSSNFLLNTDPTLSGSFTLTNLSGITQIFSLTATMGLLPVAGPTTFQGGYGESTYTDANGDSNVTFASPTLAQPGTAAFMTAMIDGSQVAVTGAFNDNANSSGGTGPVGGTEGPGTFGPSSGPGISSSIGTAFAFSLTPGDTVSVPFEFVVVPEPDGLAAFAIVFALFLCRFAQKNASA
jgi:hypothetical protein